MPELLKLRDAVDAMIKILVIDSEAVIVELQRAEDGATLHVLITSRDLGKVIGKKGRTVSALRILIHAAAQKIDKRVSVDIADTATMPTCQIKKLEPVYTQPWPAL